jgi:hypothetical protein
VSGRDSNNPAKDDVMTAQPVSKSLAIISLGLLCLLAGACESDPAPDATTSTIKAGETAVPPSCFYGDPVVQMIGRKLMVSCPDGGDGIEIECDGAPVKPRFLNDGRVVAACTDGKMPQVSSPPFSSAPTLPKREEP